MCKYCDVMRAYRSTTKMFAEGSWVEFSVWKAKMEERSRRGRNVIVKQNATTLRRCVELFPLTSIDSVISLFRSEVSSSKHPDLALLSIALGAVECGLTCDSTLLLGKSSVVDTVQSISFPVIQLAEVDTLYQKFSALIHQAVPPSILAPCRKGRTVVTTRDAVRTVSNVVWSFLSSSYHKDRAHIQSLYSLLTSMCILYKYNCLTLNNAGWRNLM